jgi:hypothetical protein
LGVHMLSEECSYGQPCFMYGDSSTLWHPAQHPVRDASNLTFRSTCILCLLLGMDLCGLYFFLAPTSGPCSLIPLPKNSLL